MVVLIGSCSRNVFDSSDILVALSLFMFLNRAKKIAYRSGDDFKHQVLLITKVPSSRCVRTSFRKRPDPVVFFS